MLCDWHIAVGLPRGWHVTAMGLRRGHVITGCCHEGDEGDCAGSAVGWLTRDCYVIAM